MASFENESGQVRAFKWSRARERVSHDYLIGSRPAHGHQFPSSPSALTYGGGQRPDHPQEMQAKDSMTIATNSFEVASLSNNHTTYFQYDGKRLLSVYY